MKLLNLVLFLSLLFSTTVSMADNSRFPKPAKRFVNDYAGILNSSEKDYLERKLRNYHDSTSTQVAVVLMKDLNGEPASSYAPALGEYWQVGQKGKDNGLVILVSMDNPREIFIATGYGMEATITDARSKNIIENIIKPSFVKGRFYEGLDQATTAIIQYSFGEHQAVKTKGEGSGEGVIIFLIFMAIFIIAALKNKGNSRGGRSGPTTLSRRGAYMGGFGGGFGGGGFGGGSGGGFGGFGGGSFGGGGAGGKW